MIIAYMKQLILKQFNFILSFDMEIYYNNKRLYMIKAYAISFKLKYLSKEDPNVMNHF